MNKISLLSQETIDQIAAGEVVERPASIVKELVENSIDAGANAVTVEIKDGGTSLIRITDNGSGIPKDQVQIAFLRHATSKIRKVEDLLTSGTLGFRGEALSSIAAVSQVEMITKTPGSLTGVRYTIEGGLEKSFEEIGAPEGTTFLVRNLFYNTPARKKFLKTATTEAGYVSDLMERLALSNPGISFKFINNRETKLHTSGNCNLKDIVYGIYGREIAANVIKIESAVEGFRITGFIGKPVISRGNRNYENYFVNGRYVKSAIVSRAIEDAYKPFMMTHRYPFTVLAFDIDPLRVDVNVHPTKLEVRFSDQAEVYDHVLKAVKDGLVQKEMIPEISIDIPAKSAPSKQNISENTHSVFSQTEKPKVSYPEPFEKIRNQLLAESKSPYEIKYPERRTGAFRPVTGNLPKEEPAAPVQMDLFDHKLLSESNIRRHKLIGQLFDTYWLIEFEEKLFIIDQHAAHEKVLYERLIKKFQQKEHLSQMITPPKIVTLNMQEEQMLKKHKANFTSIGFEIEHFGGKDYSISSVPADLYGMTDQMMFTEILDGLMDVSEQSSFEVMCDKIATMACKAAVKGKHRLSLQEADALIQELLLLDNPYNCPHGRPTIISMSKYELEKKFKRIV